MADGKVSSKSKILMRIKENVETKFASSNRHARFRDCGMGFLNVAFLLVRNSFLLILGELIVCGKTYHYFCDLPPILTSECSFGVGNSPKYNLFFYH